MATRRIVKRGSIYEINHVQKIYVARGLAGFYLGTIQRMDSRYSTHEKRDADGGGDVAPPLRPMERYGTPRL
jgi:hypothetical protein